MNDCCQEKDAEILHLQNMIVTLEKQLSKLQDENDALIMDVAFYGGNMINLSCNNK
jgi:hypothetical protein